MQIINLDISRGTVLPPIYAKQKDVGRTFQIRISDNGIPYQIPENSALSVWFDGASGAGNYTEIDNQQAITVEGDVVTVELISEMLLNHGTGELCITINSANGDQIGLWNIPYIVERKPGAGSEEAIQYYTAFSDGVSRLFAVAQIFTPDATLSREGSPADARATGDQINLLTSRINALFAIPAGSTSLDAEVIDARIDVDGYDHGSVGDAIRAVDQGVDGRINTAVTKQIDLLTASLPSLMISSVATDSTCFSAQAIVERFAPTAFTVTGPSVSCTPVRGSHLEVSKKGTASGWIYHRGKNFAELIGDPQKISYRSSADLEKDDVEKYGYCIDGLPAGTYTLYAHQKGTDSGTFLNGAHVGSDGVRKAAVNLVVSEGAQYARTVTLAAGEKIYLFASLANNAAAAKALFDLYDIQCELGNVKTDYEPCRGGKYLYEGDLTPCYAVPGVNYIWTDSGEITVTGRVDPAVAQARLESRLAALEAAIINQ